MPPETGASSALQPWSAAMAATARALSTSTVEQSSSTAPGVIAGMMSAATDCRIVPLGSMVMTTSAPLAAEAASSAMVTPSGAGVAMS